MSFYECSITLAEEDAETPEGAAVAALEDIKNLGTVYVVVAEYNENGDVLNVTSVGVRLGEVVDSTTPGWSR